MKQLRLGFIGAGFISRFHALALTQIRGGELVGVTGSRRSEEFARWASSLGIGECKAYADVPALCQACDAVVINSPNFTRIAVMEAIVAAVKAGAPLKGVICEKPLGRTLAEARRLVELANEAGLATAYLENQIHMKPLQAQLRQLEPQQRTMGPLALARSSEEHAGPHNGWFWDPTRQGGGVLSDMGCHSIAAVWYLLTPAGEPSDFLEPIAMTAEIALLKWGQPAWREKLLNRHGVDYAKTPAEDFATGVVTFRNPKTGQIVKGQFTNSWMFDKQGLRLLMDGMGPGYAFEINTLQSPLNIFIGDAAADAIADAEQALEKATSSRGLLSVIPNEADLYGYTDEIADAIRAFETGGAPLLDWNYGLAITRLVMAAYLAAERKQTIDLTSPAIQRELETFQPLVAQGRGGEIL